jgi:hypothetical protein
VRVHFDLPTPLPAASEVAWDFGDGTSATGVPVDHVYLARGEFSVKARVGTAGAAQEVTLPLSIHLMDHLTPEAGAGNLADYVPLVAGYDVQKLDEDPLRELVLLLADAARPQQALAAAETFLARFPQSAAANPVRRVLAEARAAAVVYGHIHLGWIGTVPGVGIVVNTGSVGFPFDGDARASYALLERRPSGWTAELRRVAYDVERAAAAFPPDNPSGARWAGMMRAGSREP